MVKPEDHEWPFQGFLAFAVLGNMSESPDYKLMELIQEADGPAVGVDAELIAAAIQNATATRISVKREGRRTPS